MEGLLWNRKRVPSIIKEKLIVPEGINRTWSIDFMSDSLSNGRRFRILNVMDDYNRESLAFYSIPDIRLIQKLKEFIFSRPKTIPKTQKSHSLCDFFVFYNMQYLLLASWHF